MTAGIPSDTPQPPKTFEEHEALVWASHKCKILREALGKIYRNSVDIETVMTARDALNATGGLIQPPLAKSEGSGAD